MTARTAASRKRLWIQRWTASLRPMLSRPRTLDAVGQIGFDHVLGGHGALESGHGVMRNVRNYIEELTGRVERTKESGLNVAEMQKQITADSLKSLASNGYGASLASAMTAGRSEERRVG